MEFAVVLPILLLFVFGVIEFSAAFYDKAMLTNASREGARNGMLFREPQLCGAALESEVRRVVDQYCADHLISFGADLPVTTTVTPACPERGEELTVTVTYVYEWLVLPNFAAGITGPINLGAVTVMRMEE